MFIVGQSLYPDVFYEIYAVFDTTESLTTWLNDCGSEQLEYVKIIELESVMYPFFIIEESNNGKNNFNYIGKDEFEKKIKRLKRVDDVNTIYFNLWRLDKNTHNINFPNEQCLNGRNYHLHFTTNELQQIHLKGIENYWNEILNAYKQP